MQNVDRISDHATITAFFVAATVIGIASGWKAVCDGVHEASKEIGERALA